MLRATIKTSTTTAQMLINTAVLCTTFSMTSIDAMETSTLQTALSPLWPIY
jgi:hypothetical protein